MIDHVKGLLDEKESDHVIIETGGIGYKIFIPLQTSIELPQQGHPIKLYTHFIHKEDSMELYGFLNPFEREIFRHLITVSGVGAKLGIRILSDIPYQDVVHAIMNKDSNRLVAVSGLGKKSAEKIILELESKFKKLYPHQVLLKSDRSNIDQTAIDALLALGYREKEVTEAVITVIQKEKLTSTEEIVKSSLKILAKIS